MNKTLILILAALGLTGLGVGAGFWYANARMSHNASTVSAAANVSVPEKKPLY